MQIIVGNILNVERGVICHQVNCMGKMGAGLALSIRRKWSKVYDDYMMAYQLGTLRLGNVIFTTIVPDQLIVANLCGQYRYGRGKRYTDYGAVEQCAVALVNYNSPLPIYIPYMMGCGLAGGDWDMVKSIINNIIPHAIVVMRE